jgi:diphthamide biosynthesis protein 2
MTDAFSTPAEHAFDHEVEVSAEAGPSSMGDAVASVSIEEAFQVEDTVKRILSGGYKTVSLRTLIRSGAAETHS